MLWEAGNSRKEQSEMWCFAKHINDKYSLGWTELIEQRDYERVYQELHAFSIRGDAYFWQALIHYFDVVYEGDLEPANLDESFEQYAWFPKLNLNFAENLLSKGDDEAIAVSSRYESGQGSIYSYKQIRCMVASLQQVLKPHIAVGDVVACYMPNTVETLVTMLATTALGGVFTSTSSDFGEAGVIDRFGQSRPKVLVAAKAYKYNGKRYDNSERITAVINAVDSIVLTIEVDNFSGVNCKDGAAELAANASQCIPWPAEIIDGNSTEIIYKRVPFSSPLYIMYSSGTTGKPKCIVHSVGGTLLQHVKELGLHSDFNDSKSLFFYTTCGWMMWNWLVSALFFGGKIVLYEGSPAYPNFSSFLTLIGSENITIFGTSPKFLKALEDSDTDLSALNFDSLETLLCTGSPLLPEQYDFVYESINPDLLLASIAGGTDILGCFFLGNPLLPVYRGELQCAGLGMAVACFDVDGNKVVDNEGELVCLRSFPSRPIGFLNDKRGERLKEAYFSKFESVWYHGDYIAITERGGAIFYGRSDATLNPGGVRIGTSEIYRQTEKLPYIEDSVCVGFSEQGDVSVVLFVKLAEKEILSDERIAEIKTTIKHGATPRHIPRYIYAIEDIPYTRSGKKVELAVSKLINGKPVNNVEALANPESLRFYEKLKLT